MWKGRTAQRCCTCRGTTCKTGRMRIFSNSRFAGWAKAYTGACATRCEVSASIRSPRLCSASPGLGPNSVQTDTGSIRQTRIRSGPSSVCKAAWNPLTANLVAPYTDQFSPSCGQRRSTRKRSWRGRRSRWRYCLQRPSCYPAPDGDHRLVERQFAAGTGLISG